MKKKHILITIIIVMLPLILLALKGTHFSANNDRALGEQELEYRQVDNYIFPYDLSHPSKKCKLPHCLDEISGLSYFSRNLLMCIQDEKGILYVFDIEKKQVIKKFKFGEEKDYEDIEIVKKSAYVLQSNGTILKIKKFETNEPKIKKYNTLLSGNNNTEGLAFDNESGVLLIACKGSPQLEEKYPALKGKKAIYQFDLKTKELSEKPVYLIDEKYVKNSDFCPSGIAVHPITKNIYLISSVARMLIILNRGGDVIYTEELKKKIFKQPEGICFNPEGDLFISNESKNGRANILMFTYKH